MITGLRTPEHINPYQEILASLLSPWTNAVKREELLLSVNLQPSPWQEMFDLSAEQWCTSILYETLRMHGCLDAVPPSIRNQLRSNCLENRLRNQLLKMELIDLLHRFAEAGIELVLLKGAATFADDLYGSIGARSMLDLDLLITQDTIEAACSLLKNAGYEEIVDEHRILTGLPMDQRHAHINNYQKPGTPLLIELHYNIAYGQGGRILPAAEGWRHITEVDIEGVPAFVLRPTYRLLHNTVHGLISSRDYIKGEIRFWHLLEFAFLVKQYSGEIDWQAWLQAAAKEKHTTAFLAWLLLAHKLFAMPLPVGIPIGIWPRLQSLRLKHATLLHNWQGKAYVDNGFPRLNRLGWFLHRVYYYCHLPAWVWRNICYAEGWRNLPVRVRYFLNKMMNKRSWRKI